MTLKRALKSAIMSALDKNKADRHAIVVFVFSLSSSLFFVVTNWKKSQSFFSPLKLIIFDHQKSIRSWSKRYTMAKDTTSYWLARLKQWHLRPENGRGRPLKEDTLYFYAKLWEYEEQRWHRRLVSQPFDIGNLSNMFPIVLPSDIPVFVFQMAKKISLADNTHGIIPFKWMPSWSTLVFCNRESLVLFWNLMFLWKRCIFCVNELEQHYCCCWKLKYNCRQCWHCSHINERDQRHGFVWNETKKTDWDLKVMHFPFTNRYNTVSVSVIKSEG